MPIPTFFSAAGMVFLTELGDKTMLTTMCLSAQYRRPGMVLLSTTLALTTSTFIAVLIGVVMAAAIPVNLIVYLSGALFIGLGIYTLVRSNNEEVDTCDNPGTLLSMFSLVLFSELGDKSQIAIIALAAQSIFPLMIFIGAIASFIVVNAIGAVAGDRVAGRIQIQTIKKVTGIVFLLFGILIIFGLL